MSNSLAKKMQRADKPVDEFLPYVGHATDADGNTLDDIALLEDGRLVVQLVFDGLPLGLQGEKARYAVRRQRHAALRQLYGDNVSYYESFITHDQVPPFALGRFRSNLARQVMGDYHGGLGASTYARLWLATIVIEPPTIEGLVNAAKRAFGQAVQPSADMLRQAEDLAETALRSLRDFGAVRRGTRWSGGVPYSEIGEGIRMILYGQWAAVPRARGLLCRNIYTSRVVCGMRGFEVQHLGESHYGMMLGVDDYPERCPPWMMDAITKANACIVMTNRFRFKSAMVASKKFGDNSRQMDNVKDKASGIRDSNDVAQAEIEGGGTVSGDHQFSIAVHGKTHPELLRNVREVKAVLSEGASMLAFAEENVGCFPAYWSQVPGADTATDGRHGLVSGHNFLSFSPAIGYRTSRSKAMWGYLLRLLTDSGTAVDFDPHVRGVGHLLMIGPTGFGKTSFIGMMLLALEALLGADGMSIVLDKSGSSRLTIEGQNGNYTVIERNTARGSGAAPLKGVANTPEGLGWLGQFIRGLILADGLGPIPTYMNERIDFALAFIMRLPVEMRSLAGLRQMLDHGEESTGSRLERWCRGTGTEGWAFDGDEDRIRFLPGSNGIDNTVILTKDMRHVLEPMASYELYRIREVAGHGARVAVIADEAASYVPTDDSPFAEGFDHFSRDLRKGNGMLWMAFHHPEDLATRIGRALLNNSPRKLLYPNPNGNMDAYRTMLNCSEKEIEAILSKMMAMGEGAVLVKDSLGSFIGKLPLGGHPQHLAVLSSTPERIRLWKRIGADLNTTDADRILPEYQRRYQEANH